MAQDSDSSTTRWGRRRRTAMVIAVTALIVAPVAAYGSNVFNDVPNSNIFHDDIDWMRDTGVTKGCNPPDNDEFCPDENVTREQMAAFMHRFAQNVVPDPVVRNPVEVATSEGWKAMSNPSYVDLPEAAVDITVPAGHDALVVAQFTAETLCVDLTTKDTEWCSVRILADGTEMNPKGNPAEGSPKDFVFDSTDNGTASYQEEEAHAVTRSIELGPGTHTIKVQWSVTHPNVRFRLDDFHLLVEAHLQ